MSASGQVPRRGFGALLPAGLEDVLAPEAAEEAETIERLLARFASWGYERVKPPLIEFEDSLLAGPGAQVASQTFRLMDPVSQRMMGLRADITPQVARIAAYRLAAEPRPLRLCYAGQVLRVKGSQLRPERQFAQAGVELIGAAGARADAEVVLLAAEALGGVGIAGLSIDLSLPTLVGTVTSALGLSAGPAAELRDALDRKDAAAVEKSAGAARELFAGLLAATGDARPALARLEALELPEAAAAQVKELAGVLRLLEAAEPGAALTLDPTEHRGYEYQTGLSFALFAKGVRGELGRGGRYLAPGPENGGQPATGFTLYLDSVRRGLAPPGPRRKLFLPVEVSRARARALRAEGWVTLAALEASGEPLAEARRQGCTHVLLAGEIRETGGA